MAESGAVVGIQPSLAGATENFGLRFVGFLQIDKSGDYTFYAGGDDGVRLFIDGEMVVDGDGVHGFQFFEGRRHLEPGPHPIEVQYFQAGGEAELEVEFSGPGIERAPLAAHVTLDRQPGHDDVKAFTIDPALVKQGRELFASLGCAACHEMKHDGKHVASTLSARPLSKLRNGAGCLNAAASPGIPQFALSDAELDSLGAAVRAFGQEPAASLTPADDIHRTLMAMNCYACHARDGRGGVEADRNAFFKTTQPEMGDEGRIPPPLTGVGDKLREEYIRHIFDNGGEDRPYMLTHMPKFGGGNLQQLAALLHKTDAKDSPPAPEFAASELSRAKADGRMLVGAGTPEAPGLSCINCHDFGKLPSKGIRSMNMTRMTQRLRHDWFSRYLLNPQAYRPGTRMPAAWPDGQVFYRKVLGGDARRQIEAVWLYLADGDKAPPPRGLGGTQIELVADKEPVIYRNFIEGAGRGPLASDIPRKPISRSTPKPCGSPSCGMAALSTPRATGRDAAKDINRRWAIMCSRSSKPRHWPCWPIRRPRPGPRSTPSSRAINSRAIIWIASGGRPLPTALANCKSAIRQFRLPLAASGATRDSAARWRSKVRRPMPRSISWRPARLQSKRSKAASFGSTATGACESRSHEETRRRCSESWERWSCSCP